MYISVQIVNKMIIKNLKLKNFRNHSNKGLQFSEGCNLILGDNGVGKTNILEAIHMLSLAKSPLTKFDKDVINHNADFANIECYAEKDNEEFLLQISLAKNDIYDNKTTKKLSVNGVGRGHSAFIGNLYTSLFIPEDLSLVTGSPTRRRMYMDSILVQTNPKYKNFLSEYRKVVKRRNKLLESINKLNTGFNQLKYWDDKLIETGMFIQESRQKFFQVVNELISDHTTSLGDSTDSKVLYIKNELSLERLDRIAQYEIKAMRTLLGPHRDNFTFELNSHNAGQFSSRGQKRTLLLALKLCELDYFVNTLSIRPVLLLDDIFSELDAHHKEAVNDIIGKQQTFITSVQEIRIKAQRIML